MIEELDLKTVFLAFGDREEYLPFKGEDSIHCLSNLIMKKEKIKPITYSTYENKKTKDTTGYFHLCQIKESKIYLIGNSRNTDFIKSLSISIRCAFYSDSIIDAKNQLGIELIKFKKQYGFD